MNNELEIWKPILLEDYPGYEVSNLGRVRSFRGNTPGKILSQFDCSSKDKHQKVGFTNIKTGKKIKKFVHRLVMMTFCPCENMENLQVNHIDGNPLNNKLTNLEWVSDQQNKQHYKEVIIPQRREEGNFNLGAKKQKIKVTFKNGIINYYNGQEEAVENLGINKSTLARWIKNGTKNEIEKIELVNDIPNNWINTPQTVTKMSVPKKVKVVMLNGEIKFFDNCKEASAYFNLSQQTFQRWLSNPPKSLGSKLLNLKIKTISYEI